MHGAPAVIHPVGRSRFAAAAMACTWVVAAAGLVLWRIQVEAGLLRVICAACFLIGAGALALRSWLGSPQGSLSWDGEGWSWSAAGDAAAGTPVAVLDLQHLLLLRWSDDKRPVRWLWAERGAQPSTWDDLRRAVYSRARPGGAAQRA